MEKSVPRCQFFHTPLLTQDQCVLPPVSQQGDCQPNQGRYPQEAENAHQNQINPNAQDSVNFTSQEHKSPWRYAVSDSNQD